MRQSPAGRPPLLTCLDGEVGGPQEDGALLAHGTGWMGPYQDDGYFEYGMLNAPEVAPGRRFGALR